MSDEETSKDDFPDFKGKPDVEEDGFTTSEIGIGFGFILLIAGFILGLIRLMALNGESNQETFDTNLEQLYLGYLLMFVVLKNLEKKNRYCAWLHYTCFQDFQVPPTKLF